MRWRLDREQLLDCIRDESTSVPEQWAEQEVGLELVEPQEEERMASLPK